MHQTLDWQSHASEPLAKKRKQEKKPEQDSNRNGEGEERQRNNFDENKVQQSYAKQQTLPALARGRLDRLVGLLRVTKAALQYKYKLGFLSPCSDQRLLHG